MNICFISDHKYLHYAKTMVNSLLQNNASHDIHLFLVSDDITQEQADTAFASILTDKTILTVISVTKEDIGCIETNKRFGHYIFYRIFFYKFFPEDVSVVLSLDVDMIINGDLSPVFKTRLDRYALAACVDQRPICEISFSNQQREKYGLDPQQIYYNAGLMLMNLDKMRSEDKGDLMLNAGMQDSSLGWPEQDLINIFFKNEICTLPGRFNHGPFKYVTTNEIGVDPVVVHYWGPRKPDYHKYEGEYVQLYWNYVVDRPVKLWMSVYA